MPQLSDTMTEGVVVTWEKQAGDRVERGDIVATVETDKAIMDVEVFKAAIWPDRWLTSARPSRSAPHSATSPIPSATWRSPPTKWWKSRRRPR
jgi:hypothetical protein